MLERRGDVSNLSVRRSNGGRVYLSHYRWAQALPLRGTDDALTIDWCELTTTNEAGKTLYQNSSTSSIPINEGNVPQIVAAGRARWEIENCCWLL